MEPNLNMLNPKMGEWLSCYRGLIGLVTQFVGSILEREDFNSCLR